ncbi:hypothetical protein [Methylosarcina fibrata]|uniref:hypothetical protein n=1 Tax=Methylosarcina fibrata TaxID=105972 RepID=UPI00036787F9|nr:hypothetical protein [Methylosarcina fibrata]
MKNFSSFAKLTKKSGLVLMLGIALAAMIETAWTKETESGSQDKKAVAEKDRQAKRSPDFREADKNGDHYVTKQELKKDYPYLLKYFDKVDTGEDGRLEQHEFENLIMENERDNEARPI